MASYDRQNMLVRIICSTTRAKLGRVASNKYNKDVDNNEKILAANGRKHISKGIIKLRVRREKEKEDDSGDAGEIYEAGMGNNAQIME